MAATAGNSSILVNALCFIPLFVIITGKISEPKDEKYNTIVRVPPKKKLQQMSQVGGCVYTGKQFDTGYLSKVHHSWKIALYPDEIRVLMNLQQRDNKNNRYTLKPIHLELITKNKVRSRHEMHFQSTDSVFNPKIRSHAYWMNDGSWDDKIDSVRIVVQVSRESAGSCFENNLWTAECKEALAAHTQQDYRSFYLNTDLTDVNIQCKDQTFPAHKKVLANRSPMFKMMLSKDSKTKQTITINDFEPEVVKVFLKFMYSGELDVIRESLCMSLSVLSVIYQVDALRMLCEQQLTDKLTKDNCLQYFQRSVKMDAPLLKAKAWEIITKNCKELLFSDKEENKFFFEEFPHLFLDLARIADSNLLDFVQLFTNVYY